MESITNEKNDDADETNQQVSAIEKKSDVVAPVQKNAGVAELKREYILTADELKAKVSSRIQQDNNDDDTSEPATKRAKSDSKYKQKRRGQNKARPMPWREARGVALCLSLMDIAEGEQWPEKCERNRCDFIHNVSEYLTNKPPDIGDQCYVFRTFGRCPRGATCRYGSEHLTEDGHNKINLDLYNKQREPTSFNQLNKDVQFKLRKYKYDFSTSDKVLQKTRETMAKERGTSEPTGETEEQDNIIEEKVHSNTVESETTNEIQSNSPVGPVSDEDLIKLRNGEKKTISWQDKLYLSPLTTLGNLPFRRICKSLGADITCGEMAMVSSLLKGAPQEWALVRRHESEDLFGAQVCGSNPYTMTKCAQLLQETINLDFIDINMGCPIDLVYQQGGGSGLLRRRSTLETIVRSMSQILTIPLTIKTRTGVCSDKNISHTLMPSLKNWGVSLITLHGRSREQRYTRSADWGYIDKCARLADPVPLFGNGDILSFEDYNIRRENTSVSGVMIGRGALIKPWIFTEIKEQRHWDISSSERMEFLKKFANYGLEHWGSDNKGVENTRRFLLEWLSFLYRYIPVGLLEHLPQCINERPPAYKGRDDLETLMASPNCADWVTISEMLLGKVPDGFNFLPKHKANSWN